MMAFKLCDESNDRTDAVIKLGDIKRYHKMILPLVGLKGE